MTVWTSTFALSCAEPFPTFDEMAAEAIVLMHVDVESVSFEHDSSEDEYCENVWSDGKKAGTYTYEVSVRDVVKWPVDWMTTLTRKTDGLNCTRWWFCDDMQAWSSYMVITNLSGTLAWGLCNPCPYQLVEELVEKPNNDCICTREYEPECGINWETYGNACQRECEWVTLDYKGECSTDTVSPNPDISATCTLWYDGCNTCSVTNSVVGWCTEMACVQQEEAYCIDHTFTYLSEKQAKTIDTIVNNYFTRYEWDIQNQKKQMILDRIEKKKTKIQDTLARSTFPVGSPTLKKYSLILEILDALTSAVTRFG